jgi:histone deacetylase 1/2
VDAPSSGVSPDSPGSSASSPPVPSHVQTAAINPTRPTTRASRGIAKPKEYKDGTVRWCLSTSTEEPASLDDALTNTNWKEAMDVEYDALMENQTWELVPP